MSLEEAIKKIFEKKKGRILVVDDRCRDENDYFYTEHIDNEDRCRSYALDKEVKLWLIDASHDMILPDHENRRDREYFTESKWDIILVHANVASSAA